MLRRLQRAIGSVNIVTSEFIHWTWVVKPFLSSVGTAHIVENQPLLINMYRSDGTLFYARLRSPWIKIHGYNIARADGSLKSA